MRNIIVYMDSPEYCSTCNSGGAWSGTHQYCSPLNCGYPPKLENGDQELLNSSTVLFSMVAYRCVDSYIFNTTSEKSIRLVRSILKCSLILTIFQTFTSCHNVSRMGHGPLLMSAVYLTPLHWCSPTGQPSPSASSASSSSSSQSLSAGPGVTQAASLTQSLAL